MSYPWIIQEDDNASATSSTSCAGTFATGVTAGNLIVFTMAGDKNTGALTMSDNGSSSGWTTTVSLLNANVSLYMAWRVSGGGETVITGTHATTSGSGNTCWIAEIAQTGSGAWAVQASATNITGGTNVTTVATGTTGAASYNGLGIAMMAVDSCDSATAGTWSNGYANEFDQGATPSGAGGIHTASAVIAGNATTTSTFTRTAGSATDQMSGAVVVMGRSQPPLAGLPPRMFAIPRGANF